MRTLEAKNTPVLEIFSLLKSGESKSVVSKSRIVKNIPISIVDFFVVTEFMNVFLANIIELEFISLRNSLKPCTFSKLTF